MTEPSVYAQEVSKLKDADELKQACIGLKDTNRYFICFFLAAGIPHYKQNHQVESSIHGLHPGLGFLPHKLHELGDTQELCGC